MTIAVILILAVLWIAVLTPPVLRAKGRQDRVDSVGSFNHHLGMLGRANGTPSDPGRSRRAVSPLLGPMTRVTGPRPVMSDGQRRRRDVLLALVGVAVVTLLVAVVMGSKAFVALHLVADLALGAYVALLVQYRQRSGDPRSQLRYLSEAYRDEPRLSFGDRGSSDGLLQGAPRLVPLRQTASR